MLQIVRSAAAGFVLTFLIALAESDRLYLKICIDERLQPNIPHGI